MDAEQLDIRIYGIKCELDCIKDVSTEEAISALDEAIQQIKYLKEDLE